MKLFLKDIEGYAFESWFNDSISSKLIYNDGISIIYETDLKCHINKWDLGKYHINNNGCVYFLLDKDEVVYIGQTGNANRIKQHKDKIFTDVYFIPFRFPYHIKFENQLLKKYTTKYNKRYSGVKTANRPKYAVTPEEIRNVYLNLL